MSLPPETVSRLEAIPNLSVSQDVPLSRYTRFQIGGPASALADAPDETAFAAAYRLAREHSIPIAVIGDGSNLIVSDAGFDGLVLRYTGSAIAADGNQVRAGAGAKLQSLVDFSIDHGLAGIETMTGIPGWVGGAIYGNAGAYGRSISQSAVRVRFFDGAEVREFAGDECRFRYRDSIFKQNKDWIVFTATVELEPADRSELRRTSDDILTIRNRKYPPEMRCAGSIFKNLILAELDPAVATVVPAQVVREGKVPSAWFLEQVGAKGIRLGGIHVADYHANLIYNDGAGTAADLRSVIVDLKQRVVERFGLRLEEEVQYIGW